MSEVYTFFPWLRTGLGREIRELDTPGAAHTRSSISVQLRVRTGTGTATVGPKDIQLVGPGDVLGLHDDAIMWVEPSPAARAVEPNYLPFVEFAESDLPWRYTPARPDGDRLRPWLVLLAFEAEEFAERSSAHLPAIQVNTALQLDPAQTWAWAHVQQDGELGALPVAEAVAEILRDHPERLRSRLLCPRRLVAWRRYHLFLVPAFEAGRRAGLGEDPAGVPALQSAWTLGQVGAILPVYRRWTFETGEAADFETLARRLSAAPLAPEPGPSIGLSGLRAELGLAPGTTTAELQSALHPPGSSHPPLADAALRAALATELNEACVPGAAASGGDPYALVPPLYGRWPAAATGVGAGTGWLDEINLDPGLRAVAGLGADLVGEHQERLVAEAWAQLGEVAQANDLLRRSALAAEVGERLYSRRVAGRAPASRLALATRVLGQVPASAGSVADEVAAGRLPSAALDPAMAKVCRAGTRHRRSLERLAAGTSVAQRALVPRLASDVSAAPRINPGDLAAASAPAAAASTVQRVISSTNAQDARRAVDEAIGPYTGIAAAAVRVDARLSPRAVVAQRVSASIQIPAALGAQLSAPVDAAGQVHAVMAAPELDVPAVELLLARDLRRVAPDVDRIPEDGVGLLAVNRKFVEAMLVGMNHAMGAELLWRGFPTDQRGSVFRRFWRADDPARRDIDPIDGWGAATALGSHGASDGSDLMVLVLRTELVRRFPDLEIYAQRATFLTGTSRGLADPGVAANVRLPLFRAESGGVVVVGFSLSPEAARGSTHDPGWFLLLRERLGRVRFGLDVAAAGALGDDPNGFSWPHLDALSATDSAQFIRLPASPHVFTQPSSLTWGAGSSGADVASILCQMPMTLGLHASDLIA